MDQPPRPRTERLVNKKMIAYSYLELGVIAALVCTVKCFPFVTPPLLFFSLVLVMIDLVGRILRLPRCA